MATKPVSRAGRERARASSEQLRQNHRQWAERHPARAAEERELRRARRDMQQKFGRNDVVPGTLETRAKASVVRQGAMARLYESGAISIHQLGASLEIAAAHERITLSAGVSTSWSTLDRVDCSRSPDGAFYEALGSVRMELAYSRWRRSSAVGGAVLAMIVEDIGIAAAARRYSMHVRTARRRLKEALDLWTRLHREARDEVDEATLAAAQSGVLH